MKAKNKMYFMKTLSAVLAASMAASVFTAVPYLPKQDLQHIPMTDTRWTIPLQTSGLAIRM